MLLTLAKHGGLAAGIRRVPATLDAANLPASAAAELKRLVAAARAEAPPPTGAGSARDAMSYAVTVSGDDAPQIVLRGSDAAMPPALAALIAFLERHATIAGSTEDGSRPPSHP